MNDKTEKNVSILALETEVPKDFLLRENYCTATVNTLKLGCTHAKLLDRIASGSRIRKRHTVISDLFGDDAFTLSSTGERNDLYKDAAPKLAEGACRKVLEQWGGQPNSITHVISVSCTGMIAPGIEFLMIDRLGLSRNVERLGINFMGCFGAFKGLAIAKALALESPENRILVVCTELCSLHFQSDLNLDTMVANSLFADGAAAVVVGTTVREGEKPLFNIHRSTSATVSDTQDQMTWEAGDHGYRMRLSASVPTHLEENIVPFIDRLKSAIPFNELGWAVHPGGKAILNAISRACNLQEEQLSASWKVLEEYGNMSSPTFLFVLKEILASTASKKWIVGLGFGPGLSIEGVLLNRP